MNEGDATSSLLRGAGARDPAAWQRLVNLYSPLVRHWCRQVRGSVRRYSGCLAGDICDRLREDRNVCPGSSRDNIPRLGLAGLPSTSSRNTLAGGGEAAVGGTDAQKRFQQIPAEERGTDVELSESAGELIELYRSALKQVQNQFEDRTWKAFWRVTIENASPAEVAAELGMTANAVRQAKSRVLRRLKEELGELIA